MESYNIFESTIKQLFELIPDIESFKSVLLSKFLEYTPKLVPIITLIGIVCRYFSVRNLKSKFDNSAINLVSEFYFIEDIISNWSKIPSGLRKLALYNLGKIVSKGKFISISDEKIVNYLFEKHNKDIESIKMFFQTDKLVLKDNIGLCYKRKYVWVKNNKVNKFSQYLYTTLYFILAIIALAPNFIQLFIENIDPFKLFILIIVWGACFLLLAFLSLKRFSKFYWANKLLEKIYKQ